MQFVFQQSAAYRERLKRYIQNEMQLEAGDTVMLVDVGYVGTTQRHLTTALKEELDVDIIGRYLIASNEPDRPSCKALITTTACDHGLFEQSCTFKEGAVLDYDQDGNPIFDHIRLSDKQYASVSAIQESCVRFIHDAKTFFTAANLIVPFPLLQQAAVAALRRHVYLPLGTEVDYFQSFQHDKDMGPNLTKTMYNVNHGLNTLKQNKTISHLHPYEARAYHLEASFFSLIQKSFRLDLTDADLSLYHKTIKLIVLKNTLQNFHTIHATQTHDGYFSISVPALSDAQLGIVFGENFHWLQIDNIQAIGNQLTNMQEINKHFMLNQIENRGGNLFECTSNNSLLLISPIPNSKIEYFQIVFRPIIER
jgi:hypothetical protein